MSQPTPSITVIEAAARIAAADQTAPLLVDVREAHEFGVMRVPGAVLVPLSGLSSRYGDLPRDRALLVLCAAGARSARATEFLIANGYPDVVNIAGGITAWSAAGLPIRTGAPDPGEGELR